MTPRLRTSLQNAPSAPMTPDEIEAEYRRAWLERDTAVFKDVSKMEDGWLKDAIVTEMNLKHGDKPKWGK